ncbi:AURKA, partial [Symbiodinium sp. CCMP2456]
YVRHPESVTQDAVHFFANLLKEYLHQSERMLEFMDSADWTVKLADIANLLDVYRSSFGRWNKNSSKALSEFLQPPRRPWHPGSPSWRTATLAAKQSLAWVATWRLPVQPQAQRAQALKLWVFGTHCSVMAEPISAISLLLAEEFQLHVTWKGTADYCQYHHGSARVIKDKESSVRMLFKKHWKK